MSNLDTKVRYQLVTRMNTFFTIDEKTGTIWITKPLDREISETYKLLVQAYSHGNPSFPAQTSIFVHIRDINDQLRVAEVRTFYQIIFW